MIRIFLFVTGRSLWNRIAKRLRRLREPRYLAGLVVGLIYLYFAVLRNQWRASRGSGIWAEPEFVSVLPWVLAFGAVAAWVFTAIAWIWPSTDPPLRFSGAEVQFFYTAPVSRRQLVNYKLLRSQMNVIFGVIITMLFSGGAVAAARGRWSAVLGTWLVFSTLRLHLLVIGFTRASFRGGFTTAPWRAYVPAGLMAAISAVVLWLAAVNAPVAFAEPWRIPEMVLQLSSTGIGAVALWPFRAMIAPIFTPTFPAFLAVVGPAVILLVLNYLWVLESDAGLEEAAMAAEKKQSKGQKALPAPTARRAPFALAASGRPELAILWKNLILLGRYASPRMVIRLLLPLVILAVAFSISSKMEAAAPLPLMIGGFLTMLGPYMMRNDLRHDLPRLSVLKTWPVSGATLVLGEVLAPAVVLTVLVWTAIAVTLALSDGFRLPLGWWDRSMLAASAALVAPALLAAQLLIQNAAVVMFPGWIPTGGHRPKGVEAMGQQMLMMAGTLLTLVVGLIPAVAVAGAVGFLLYLVVGFSGALPAAVIFAAVLFAEMAVAVWLLGRVIERTDPTQVEAEEA